jgi:hypothetical protein
VVEKSTTTEVAVVAEITPDCASEAPPLPGNSGDGVRPAGKRRRRYSREHRYAFDRRTQAGKRVLELIAAFREKLGAAAVSDPVLHAAVERAARLTAYSEVLSARALRGLDVSPDDVIRAARAADHATRRLRLDRRDQPDDGPTLSDILRERRDDEAAS